MMLALMALVLALGATGWMQTTDAFFGEEWLMELHEALAHGLLWAAGLHVSISPDNRLMSATTLSDELRLLHEQAGLSVRDLAHMQRCAIEASADDPVAVMVALALEDVAFCRTYGSRETGSNRQFLC